MLEKGSEIWSVTPDTTVYEALRIMAEKDIGALLVVEQDHCGCNLRQREMVEIFKKGLLVGGTVAQ